MHSRRVGFEAMAPAVRRPYGRTQTVYLNQCITDALFLACIQHNAQVENIHSWLTPLFSSAASPKELPDIVAEVRGVLMYDITELRKRNL